LSACIERLVGGTEGKKVAKGVHRKESAKKFDSNGKVQGPYKGRGAKKMKKKERLMGKTKETKWTVSRGVEEGGLGFVGGTKQKGEEAGGYLRLTSSPTYRNGRGINLL